MVTPTAWLHALSIAGSIGFVFPLVVGLATVLLVSGQAVVALRWLLGIGTGVVVTLAFKAGLARHPVLPYFPSGHVALAVSCYGGLSLMLAGWPRSRPGRLVLAGAVMLAIGIAIGISRILLTDHTVLDVLGGIAVGAGGTLLAGRALSWDPLDASTRWRLALTTILSAPVALVVYRLIDQAIRRHLSF